MQGKHLYKILLPVDGSGYAIRATECIAHYAAGFIPAEVCVVNVQAMKEYSYDLLRNEALREANARATAVAEPACNYLGDAGIPYLVPPRLANQRLRLCGRFNCIPAQKWSWAHAAWVRY